MEQFATHFLAFIIRFKTMRETMRLETTNRAVKISL